MADQLDNTELINQLRAQHARVAALSPAQRRAYGLMAESRNMGASVEAPPASLGTRAKTALTSYDEMIKSITRGGIEAMAYPFTSAYDVTKKAGMNLAGSIAAIPGRLEDALNPGLVYSSAPAQQAQPQAQPMVRQNPGSPAQSAINPATPPARQDRRAEVGETVYQDANGNEISRQEAMKADQQAGFGFRAPNNDPSAPWASREYATEPTLESFNPDDSRFAKRELDIAAQQKRVALETASKASKAEAAARAESDRARNAILAQELADRRAEQERQAEDRKAEFDQKAKELAAAMEYRANFTKTTGYPYTPEIAKEWAESTTKAKINSEYNESVNHVNLTKESAKTALDMYTAGGDIDKLVEIIPDENLKQYIIRLVAMNGKDTPASRASTASTVKSLVDGWAAGQTNLELGRRTGNGGV